MDHRLHLSQGLMGVAERFEHTAQWGTPTPPTPDAGSGIRVRPDLVELAKLAQVDDAYAAEADDQRGENTAVMEQGQLKELTGHMGTARLAPVVRNDVWTPPPSLVGRLGTQPLARPIIPTAAVAAVAAVAPIANGGSTALLAPMPATARSSSLPPAPRGSAYPPARASAYPSAPPPAPRGSVYPEAAAPVHPAAVHAAVAAAVHASVHASVQAMLSSHLMRARASELPAPVASAPSVVAGAANDDADSPTPAAQKLAPAWTPAQRIYVLATSVALAVLTTLVVHLAIGESSGIVSVTTARTARLATLSSPTSVPTVGSASRKDVSFVAAAEAAEATTGARRTSTSARPAAPIAPVGPAIRAAANGSGPATPAGTSSSAKLDDAARSAKMLRDQLSTAVN